MYSYSFHPRVTTYQSEKRFLPFQRGATSISRYAEVPHAALRQLKGNLRLETLALVLGPRPLPLHKEVQKGDAFR